MSGSYVDPWKAGKPDYDIGEIVAANWSEGEGPKDTITGFVSHTTYSPVSESWIVHVTDFTQEDWENGRTYDCNQSWIHPTNQAKKLEQSVSWIRSNYDDTYGARVELGSDIASWGFGADRDVPSEITGESILQPLIRYQSIPWNELWDHFSSKTDMETADKINASLVQYAQSAFAGEHLAAKMDCSD